MSGEQTPELMALWHPGTSDTLSGYGLRLGPFHLVGIVMVDRPMQADPQWLAKVERAFGPYQLAVMSRQGERGLVCQMYILPQSAEHLRPLVHPLRTALTHALMPLVHAPPAVTLVLMWDPASATWVSQPWQGGPV